jgi:hypothetical protein
MGFKMNNKSAAILVLLCMVLAYSASAAERKSDLRVTYNPPHISVEARGIKLREVLRDISQKVGFELTDYGIPDRVITVSIEDTTVEEVLRQLLRGENYGVVYQEKDSTISKVLLLSSPVYAQVPVTENQQIPTEASRVAEGLTIFPAAPSYQPARSEQKRETRGDSEPRVEDILQLHAMPGVTGSGTSLQNLTPNISQPLGSSTSGFPLAGSPSPTTRSLDNMNDSLAAATHLAQQSLKALVEGLATTTHSLLNYPANK